MNAPPKLSKIDQLRARDGDNCWLCGGKLAFNALPNSKRAPTKEHLQAQCDGGTDALDNLVLCHPGCNRQLGNRPKADKLKMREKRLAKRDKQPQAQAKPVPKAVPAAAVPPPVRKAAIQTKTAMPDWRGIAMIATASATFFAGLCIGMLIG